MLLCYFAWIPQPLTARISQSLIVWIAYRADESPIQHGKHEFRETNPDAHTYNEYMQTRSTIYTCKHVRAFIRGLSIECGTSIGTVILDTGTVEHTYITHMHAFSWIIFKTSAL